MLDANNVLSMVYGRRLGRMTGIEWKNESKLNHKSLEIELSGKVGGLANR